MTEATSTETTEVYAETAGTGTTAIQIDYKGKKLGMWLFLFTEILFFGGMFILYSSLRYRYSQEFHIAAMDENLVLGSINTFVLLTSSLTMALAVSAIKKGERKLSIRLQAATMALGAVFLFIKGFEWIEKILRGLYPDSPVLLGLSKGQIAYFGLYYVMTGLHGLHVLIGIVAIGFMIFYTIHGTVSRENFIRLENTGLYWSFVDVVWIYLFPLFYLVT